MYNLFVSANKKDWEGGNFHIEKPRCINKNEYTDEELAEKYGKLRVSDVKELIKHPCIFAYEEGCKKNPKFGYVKQVVKGKGSLEISYKIIKLKRFLTHSEILESKFELGIPNWEMTRTHWALKNVDLTKVLLRKRIVVPALSNKKTDPKSKRKRTKNSWYKNPVIMVPAVAIILAAIISAPWWPDVIKTKTMLQVDEIPASTAIPPEVKTLRPLKPLETGKKIGEIPNGVYFFSDPYSIESEIEDPERDAIRASGKENSYYFELQKIEGRYYILGYISDEAQSKIGAISKSPIFTQLSPNTWGGANNLVAIPFDAVYTIRHREINLDEVRSVTIFDVGFKEVVENPEFHKTKEL